MELNITTRKEKLLAQIYELENQLRALRGEEPKEPTNSFYREADNAYEHDLKNRLARLPKIIEEQKAENDRKAKTEAYYATEEGAARKARLLEQKDLICRQYDATKACSEDMMKTWIKDFLGAHWTVRRMSKGRISFGIWDADKAQFVFGSEIEVDVERNRWHDGDEEFSTNVGAMGSFDIMDTDPVSRARFYMDLGKFLSDKERLTNLKNFMYLYEDQLTAIADKAQALNAELINPLGL